ncbi:MAG TPA: hypothetical protein VIV06_03115 [Candidatus Limnocylindrales bacterium]
MSTPTTRRFRIERLSQRSRRLIGIVTLLGLPAMFAWYGYWSRTSVPNVVWGPVSFLLIGTTVVGALVLYQYVRDRADLAGRQLDERERQLRDKAWILAYQVLALVVVVIGAAVVVPVLGFGQPVTIDASLATAVALCLGVLLPVLPVVALAWIEPDPVEER